METPYVLTFGSFIRNGKYPLEADYIFESEEALKEWEELNRKYLHKGLFKVVVLEDKQVLYWYDTDTFKPILESDTLENVAYMLKDFELHGTLKDLIRDFLNSYNSKLKALQLELDETLSGVGLNGDGSFDELNIKNTTYLDGAKSIIECLKALDREMSDLVVDAFILDAYYDPNTEDVVITFLTKQEKVKTIRINVANLIREWEPDNDIPDKVVEITRTEVYGGGADKVSADVRLSTKKENILEKDGNTLIVRGTTDNITHEGESLATIINEIKKPEPHVFDTYQDAVDANLKVGETFVLNEEISYQDQYKMVTSDSEIEDRGVYLIVGNNKAMSTENKGSGRNSEEVVVENNVITLVKDSKVQLITLIKLEDGYYLSVGDNKYLNGTYSASSNTLGTGNASKASIFNFRLGANNLFAITTLATDGETLKKLLFNLSSNTFSCYEGTLSDVNLYKKIEPVYKGYYVVTEEGFKILSLDAILKANINLLSLDFVNNSVQVEESIDLINTSIDCIKENVTELQARIRIEKVTEADFKDLDKDDNVLYIVM